MSTAPPLPEPPQPWHTSTQIRAALTLVIVPLFIRVCQHTKLGPWIYQVTGIDIVTMKADDIINWLMLLLAATGSGYWIHKRVKAGKDPSSSAPQIIPPTIVQRLTGNVKIVPKV